MLLDKVPRLDSYGFVSRSDDLDLLPDPVPTTSVGEADTEDLNSVVTIASDLGQYHYRQISIL